MKVEITCAGNKDPDYRYTKEAVELLLSYGCEVFAPTIPDGILPKQVQNTFANDRELEIVLGGDGTIMRAAHRTARRQIPIIGVNLGHVGYLAELEPEEISRISEYFDGDCTIEKRIMLDISLLKNGERVGSPYLALNDVTITRGSLSKLLEMNVREDGKELMKIRSDGIILSTPTGSTAYSLSAGGPVIDPRLNVFSLVPVCPQSPACKPVVMCADGVLDIEYFGHAGKVNLSVDGKEIGEMAVGDVARVSRSEYTTDFVRFKKEHKSFFDVMKEKLGRL